MVRLAALSLLTVVIWCWQNHRLTRASWSVPLDYTGDSLEILARIKASSEGDLMPFRSHVVHRLAAPFVADWSEYPGSDDLASFGLGVLARGVGVVAAANLAVLLAHLTAAWGFYLASRLLRHRWEWAFAGALLFAFSFFSLTRGLPHLWLTFTWTVPLALLSCWLIAGGRRTTARPAWRWLGYGTAAALGASNPYNLFLYLQLLAWAVLIRWWRSRGSPAVRLGVVWGLVAVGGFGAIHAHLLLDRSEGGGPPLLVRNYAGTEIYALKPIELFLPPTTHHGAWLSELGYRYLRWTNWRGEVFSPYLGIVGAIGLVWMLVAFVRSAAVERRGRRPGYALAAAWILLFSAIGGINSILAFYTGLDVFRASNRNSIFLLALALLFLAARLTRSTRTWRPGWRLGMAALVGLVGLWDQLPVRAGREAGQQLAARVDGDRRFGAEMERRLGAGAMVFELPILDFPEGRPQLQVNEYDGFRPYLFTRSLRFSYGEIKNRARDAWQHDCRRLAPAELVQVLESYGFSGIYLDRRGYPDQAKNLLAAFAAAGCPDVIQAPSPGECLVVLHPAAHPQPPFAHSFTYGDGWNRLELAGDANALRTSPPSPEHGGAAAIERPSETIRWTDGSASLSYYNPLARPLQGSLRLAVSGVGERTVMLLVDGRELGRVRVGGTAKEIDVPTVDLRPGVNRIDLVTPEPAIRVSQQRLHLRAIAVHEMQMRLTTGLTVELTGDPGGAR